MKTLWSQKYWTPSVSNIRFAEILRRPPGEIYQAWYVIVERCSLLWSSSTGKTMLAKTVANKCNANFISIRVSSLPVYLVHLSLVFLLLDSPRGAHPIIRHPTPLRLFDISHYLTRETQFLGHGLISDWFSIALIIMVQNC
jgi:hypothetical protein